jgi:uncharacterized caspase-like protein
LIVGVGQDLPSTVNDATALAALLRDPARAAYPEENVTLLTEAAAARDDILAAFSALRKKTLADPEATAIVFLSGHGARIGPSEDRARYYFLPHGHDPARLDETCLSDREVSSAIAGLCPKKLLVLFDCCHAAGIPLAKAEATFAAPALPAAALDELSRGEGRVVLSSCRPEERSFAASPYSLFTACLLEALEGRAPSHLGFARVLEVASYVIREVPLRHPRQHPFLNRVESLTESFALCRVPAAAPKNDAKSAAVPEWKRKAARLKINSYSSAYELRLRKLEKLRLAHAITADAALRFQYEHQIEAAEAEVRSDERTLEALYAELG